MHKGLELMERIKPKLEDVYRAKAAIAAKQAAERDAAARKQQVRADARVNTIQQAEMEQLEKRLLALGAKPDELPSAGLPPPQAVAESPTAPVVHSPAVPAYANLAAPPSDVNSNKNAAIAMSAAAAAAAAASVASVAATAATSPYPALSPSALATCLCPPQFRPHAASSRASLATTGDPPAYQAPPSAPPMDSPVKQESIVYSTLPPVQSMPMPSEPPAVAAACDRRCGRCRLCAAARQRDASARSGIDGWRHIGNRPVILDGEILSDFMRLVHANTARGIETCGVLTGKLESSENDDGRFIVTHLILPRQKGTQNTCEMIDEDTLFDFQMKHDLMTLGWIHTHPTQSCFLSSVDLHTHLGYQLMLPEAIAIVMAPTDRRAQFGVFSLSEIGVDAIRNCQQKSFHVHRLPDADIYSNAAHVRWRQGRPQYRLVDFR
jgi:proteasome lid subunit RPN8/RPN11